MRYLRVVFGLLVCLAVCSPAQATHVYLLRGLGDVFSTGLDEFAAELNRAGFRATVHSYTDYLTLAQEAASEQRRGEGPIVIIGHSYGADAAFDMAEEMKKVGAAVRLIVSFGPTVESAAPSNVHEVTNYFLGSLPVHKGAGFVGSIHNIDLNERPGIDHFNVDKIASFHREALGKIRLLGAQKRSPTPGRARMG